ncbi:MAG: zinc ribbon domain-containing protein [Oscillospiraceae bacterium]|nr:zinc ribbon domain-containing protein [Oscillospiraceae bacterium]
MKCPYCGGEVGLEERFCSYCGQPNEQAQRHHQDMAHFRKQYAATEADVVGKAERYAQTIPRVVVILILLIASVVMWAVSSDLSLYPEKTRRRAAERNPEPVIDQLEGYLAERNYMSFASYFEYNDLRTYNSPFEDYSDLCWCAVSYQDLIIQTEKLFLHSDTDSWIKYSASYDIQRLCQTIDSFIEYADRAEQTLENEAHLACVADMRANVMGVLRLYLGVGEDEAEEFLALSENRKAARVEEVILGA